MSDLPAAAADPGGAARQKLLDVRDELAKVVVGQDGVVTGLLTALVVRGHILLEGVPGVAKTLIAKTLAQAMALDFGRVQFTPDLMPADITGQLVLDPSDGSFAFRSGPLFANLARRSTRRSARSGRVWRSVWKRGSRSPRARTRTC